MGGWVFSSWCLCLFILCLGAFLDGVSSSYKSRPKLSQTLSAFVAGFTFSYFRFLLSELKTYPSLHRHRSDSGMSGLSGGAFNMECDDIFTGFCITMDRMLVKAKQDRVLNEV